MKDYNPITYGEECSLRFQAGDFNTEWVKTDDAGLLCETKKREILRNCYKFIYDIVEALEARFPETGLVVAYCSFVGTARRR